ncbi:RNA-binding S4 domain-containing protein [Tenuifilum thalassicum]|uniref:RNA-binding S4 domain-containing protein n=1 Tax=Tenuifilum thalassicum TaxID=2590900 RepID=A0A7D4CAE6_9BACT|nr:RNA-binding S4 domain-containing protein [Tenuifilum thalassicum]QKG80722.1 RNA-binding S4 domain-containing protein [Tenuifilum thalassicum]
MASMRVDKWLWFVRVFKTRTQATDACRKGRVTRDGINLKPSQEVQPGETITVRKPPVNYTFKVKDFPKSRVGAKLVENYLENLTPPEELQKLDPAYMAFNIYRERGTGRPTKKERREIDELLDSGISDFDWDDTFDVDEL